MAGVGITSGLHKRYAGLVDAKTGPLPPYAGAYQPQSVDERGLWAEMDEDERSLRDSPAVLKDEALNASLRRVLCDTVGQDRCAGVCIYVVRVADYLKLKPDCDDAAMLRSMIDP